MIYLIILGWLACGMLGCYIISRYEGYSYNDMTYGAAIFVIVSLICGFVTLIAIGVAFFVNWIVAIQDKPIFKKK